MVGKIYELKNRLIEQLEKDARDKGVDRLDGDMVDMVKDLACAEKDCWEAEYYRSVTEAMDGASGYMPMGYQGQGGSSMGYRMSGRGSGNQYGGRRGYSEGSYGYNDGDPMEHLRTAMQGASAEERERMKAEARKVLGM